MAWGEAAAMMDAESGPARQTAAHIRPQEAERKDIRDLNCSPSLIAMFGRNPGWVEVGIERCKSMLQ